MDDLGLLVNTPSQTESLLFNLKQIAATIGLYVKSVETKFMSFNQDYVINSLNGKNQELVDHSIWLESNISSMENIGIVKA